MKMAFCLKENLLDGKKSRFYTLKGMPGKDL
jgi:hypothetical protein